MNDFVRIARIGYEFRNSRSFTPRPKWDDLSLVEQSQEVGVAAVIGVEFLKLVQYGVLPAPQPEDRSVREVAPAEV